MIFLSCKNNASAGARVVTYTSLYCNKKQVDFWEKNSTHNVMARYANMQRPDYDLNVSFTSQLSDIR